MINDEIKIQYNADVILLKKIIDAHSCDSLKNKSHDFLNDSFINFKNKISRDHLKLGDILPNENDAQFFVLFLINEMYKLLSNSNHHSLLKIKNNIENLKRLIRYHHGNIFDDLFDYITRYFYYVGRKISNKEITSKIIDKWDLIDVS